MSFLVTTAKVAGALLLTNMPAPAMVYPAQYTISDRNAVVAFWNQSGRYSVDFADESSPYQPRQTPEGSTWLLSFSKKLSGTNGKVIPGQYSSTQTAQQKKWSDWVEAKYAFDEAVATADSLVKNKAVGVNSSSQTPKPTNPGPAPADLVQALGEPPAFVLPFLVRTHTVAFEDQTIALTDNTKVRRKYQYFRFNSGVMHPGERMSGKTLDDLKPMFAKLGVDDRKLRVMSAVSLLEGGFDSLNTYDTGYVSVGFIQFACLANGSGSLGQVLLNMKTDNPAAFNRDFHRYGLEVTPGGDLVTLDLASGEELSGPQAAQQIIKDVRLAAVFKRAGEKSDAFREAQVKTAIEQYYPEDVPITVQVGAKTYTGTIKTIIKSEAGMATLMDRIVNTGKIGDLEKAVAGLMVSYNLASLDQVADLELELVQAMRYRKDYLTDTTLSQPKPSSRTRTRNSRGK